MSELSEKLSAYLDGELTDDDARVIESALERDDALRAELETLVQADGFAKDAFAEMADEPVPLHLAAAIRDAAPPSAPVAANANTPKSSSWMTAVAAALALVVGGLGGYFAALGTLPGAQLQTQAQQV
ncbi:MAG: zf-HC2 domain-containing protein, partial [Pseudomonadota bacterium]